MKLKVIVGLIALSLIFLGSGLYVAAKIRDTTEEVERVIHLHQAELFRQDFLVSLRTMQSGRARALAAGVRKVDISEANKLRTALDECFGCHHSGEGASRLEALRDLTERYHTAIYALAMAPPSIEDGERANEIVDRLGEDLVGGVREVIAVTNARLAERTLTALRGVDRMRSVVYGLVLLGPFLSALLWLVIGSRFTRSLEALVQGTRQLKAGHLDHRVEGLRDEFAELATAFNEMAASLKEQMHLMQRTEQLVVVGELAAGLVHEIKNPLAGVKAAMQVLSQEANLSEEDRGVLKKVVLEVRGLESLLKGFLEFAKPSKPHLAEVDVNALIDSVVAFYIRTSTAKPEKPVRVLKPDPPLPTARVDPMQLQQILLNLLLNAVDAMPNGGAVEVRTAVDAEGHELQIDIADRGRGISPEHADMIFRPFFTTKPGGTGLGLAVSKRLAEQQGGSISFTANPGGGTTFRIRLPAVEAA